MPGYTVPPGLKSRAWCSEWGALSGAARLLFRITVACTSPAASFRVWFRGLALDPRGTPLDPVASTLCHRVGSERAGTVMTKLAVYGARERCGMVVVWGVGCASDVH